MNAKSTPAQIERPGPSASVAPDRAEDRTLFLLLVSASFLEFHFHCATAGATR